MNVLKSRQYLKIVSLLVGIEGLVAAVITLSFKSEGGSIFGLSTLRFGIILLLVIVSSAFIWLGLSWGKSNQLTQKALDHLAANTDVWVFLSFWLAVFLFLFNSRNFFVYGLFSFRKIIDLYQFYARFKPLLLWGLITSLEIGVAVFLTFRQRLDRESESKNIFFIWLLKTLTRHDQSKTIEENGTWWKRIWQRNVSGWVIWSGLLIVWGWIAITQIGITPDEVYWNIAGIPIFPQQIWIAVLGMLFLVDFRLLLISRSPKSGLLELLKKPATPYILMILIWAVTILVWQGERMPHTYFAPGPFPPNYEIYPFSDASRFDVGAQYFLIGKGLNNKLIVDRPYLMMMIAFYHLIAGQQYNVVIFVQIVLLGLIPALLFLLGWKMHSKPAGLGMALIFLFQQKNAIEGADQIGIANVKVLTSELPNAFLLILFVIGLFYWLRIDGKKVFWPIFTGGVLGIAIGVRVHSIVMVLFVLGITLLVYLIQQRSFKKWFGEIILFIVALAGVIGPYTIGNVQSGQSPFWLAKINQAIPRTTEALLEGNSFNYFQVGPSVIDDWLDPIWAAGVGNWGLGNKPEEIAEDSRIMLILRHFIHNEVMTVLSYPLNGRVHGLDEAFEQPYWDNNVDWLGALKLGEKVFLGINLLVFSLGIGAAYKRWQLIGLIPLFVHLGYHLTNSAARTSGGRYLVPVDWVLHIYFVFGILAIVFSIRDWKFDSSLSVMRKTIKPAQWGSAFVTLLVFVLFGCSFMFSGYFEIPYTLDSGENLFQYFTPDVWNRLEKSGVSREQVSTFVQSENSVLISGWGLYPRFYKAGVTDERSSYLPAIPFDKSRLYLLLLMDEKTEHIHVLLDGDWLNKFPNAVYTIVLGCDQGAYTDAKYVFSFTDGGVEVLESTSPELTCP